jgi:hypothetical protein
MTEVFLFVLAAALVLVVMALAREARLRRALERLLALVLQRWRALHPKDDASKPNQADSHCRDTERNARLP